MDLVLQKKNNNYRSGGVDSGDHGHYIFFDM